MRARARASEKTSRACPSQNVHVCLLDPLDPSLSFRSRIRYFDTRCQLWVQRAFASAIARVRVRACGRAMNVTSRVVGHHVTSQQPLSRLAALIEIDLYFCESRISIIRTFDLVASIFFIGRERWGEGFATREKIAERHFARRKPPIFPRAFALPRISRIWKCTASKRKPSFEAEA